MTFVHATNDSVIPWTQADRVFHFAVNALEDGDLSAQAIDERRRSIDLGEGGWTHSWGNEPKFVQVVIVKHGGIFRIPTSWYYTKSKVGHNGIMKWAPVALAVFKSLDNK